jgi:hypothetical protein
MVGEDRLTPHQRLTMKLKPKTKLVEHFSELEDPRIERTKRHKLIDIVTITLLGVICGADSWVAIESFGQAKLKWLKRILELPNGIPSHDTIARLFARLNPEQLQQCFMEWVRSLVRLSTHHRKRGAKINLLYQESVWTHILP